MTHLIRRSCLLAVFVLIAAMPLGNAVAAPSYLTSWQATSATIRGTVVQPSLCITLGFGSGAIVFGRAGECYDYSALTEMQHDWKDGYASPHGNMTVASLTVLPTGLCCQDETAVAVQSTDNIVDDFFRAIQHVTEFSTDDKSRDRATTLTLRSRYTDTRGHAGGSLEDEWTFTRMPEDVDFVCPHPDALYQGKWVLVGGQIRAEDRANGTYNQTQRVHNTDMTNGNLTLHISDKNHVTGRGPCHTFDLGEVNVDVQMKMHRAVRFGATISFEHDPVLTNNLTKENNCPAVDFQEAYFRALTRVEGLDYAGASSQDYFFSYPYFGFLFGWQEADNETGWHIQRMPTLFFMGPDVLLVWERPHACDSPPFEPIDDKNTIPTMGGTDQLSLFLVQLTLLAATLLALL